MLTEKLAASPLSCLPGSFHCCQNVHVLIIHFLSPPSPLDYEGFEVENLSHASLEMAIPESDAKRLVVT